MVSGTNPPTLNQPWCDEVCVPGPGDDGIRGPTSGTKHIQDQRTAPEPTQTKLSTVPLEPGSEPLLLFNLNKQVLGWIPRVRVRPDVVSSHGPRRQNWRF